MSETVGILISMAIVLGLGLIIVLILRLDPLESADPAPERGPDLHLGETNVARGVGDRSPLLPLGLGLIVIGTLVTLWAWFFMTVTISTPYGDTVNIDLISQRAMLHTAGLVTAVIGAVCACAGHVVNEVRRGR